MARERVTPVRARTPDTTTRRILRRGAWTVFALALLAVAVEGSEYGTRDVYLQKIRLDGLRAEVTQLNGEVDSLRNEVAEVKTSDVRLERIARERYGMVRDNEILYRTGGENDSLAVESGRE